MNRFNRVRIVQLLLTACAMYMLPVQAQSNADMQNSIQALSLHGGTNGKLVLSVTMKQGLATPPRDFVINNPPRISFDFAGTGNGLGKSAQIFNQGDLRSVNVIEAGNRTRLVINLSSMMSYATQIEGDKFLVTLDRISSTETTSRFAEAMPSGSKGHSLRNIDFRRGKNGEGRIEVTLSDTNTGIDIKQQGKKIFVDFINTDAPPNLQRKLDVTDFGTPVESVDTYAQAGNIRMAIVPRGLWEQSAYQADNKFVLELKPKVVEEAKKDNKPIYSGDKLTLNFQNIQVREALNVIADFTGLNIVISDTVSGNVTLRLKDVPWDQALDIILQSKSLDMRKNGNVIQVAPREEIAAREKVTLTAAQDVSDLEPLRTESFQLSYQKGPDVITLITNKDQRILSKRGSAVVDQRTNTLFIQDTPSHLEEARRIITQIDVPVRQVMIEARFVSASNKFTQTLGGHLGFTGPVGAGLIPPGFTSGTGGTNNVNLPTTPGGTSGEGALNMLFSSGASKLLGLELDASVLDGTSKNIASPRVVTADNVAATIISGTQIPYQSFSPQQGTTTLFKDAFLKLTVTPHVTPDDHVNMKVLASQDTVGASYTGTAGPAVDTKNITTEVLVENGGTVVIGGVYTKDVSDNSTKVPLFGDIPLIGWLFKVNTKVDNKSELLIFITPKILKESVNVN